MSTSTNKVTRLRARTDDDRPTMTRVEFVKRTEVGFPEAAIERHPSGELVIYTGWIQEEHGDTVLRWGEREDGPL